jgi:hypothetical protein
LAGKIEISSGAQLGAGSVQFHAARRRLCVGTERTATHNFAGLRPFP